MSNKEKAPLVPKLRFPGFHVSWSNDPLSRTLEEHKLKNPRGRDVFSVSMECGIVNQIEHLGRSFAATDTSRYTVGRRFDVVYTKSPLKAFPFGIVKQCKFDGEVALSPLYGVFAPVNPYVGLLIEAYFESPNRSKSFLSPLCQKGAKNTLQITNTTFLSGRMPLPAEPVEQQKIADFLSSLDELIAAQACKVDVLKIHKKGLMQQLFPCEGETQPRLRFLEFRDSMAWEMNELGKICKSIASGKDKNDLEGTFDLYGSTGVIGKALKATFDGTYILVARVGANAGFLNKVTGKFGVTDNTLTIDLQSTDQLDFVYYFLDKIGLNKFAFGSGQPLITGTQLKELRVSFPSYKEQQKIAACLTSLDTLITTATQELETLKTHKKGLMQQLFPSAEAVEA